MKIRELLDKVEPDHQFTTTPQNADLFETYGTGAIVLLRCSCGWKARRAVSRTEIDHGYNHALTQEWTDRLILNHWLDQEAPDAA